MGEVLWEAALLARWEARHGNPDRWCRLFFQVQDKETGRIVPYVPKPSQERIGVLTWGKHNLLGGQGFDFSAWKPRKGYVTTAIEYGWIALSQINEGLTGLVVSDSDDTNKSVLSMWETVDNNLPGVMFTIPAGGKWEQPGCGREGCPECEPYLRGSVLWFEKEHVVPRPRRGLWNTEQRGYEFGEERIGADGKVVFSKRAESYTLFASYKTTTFSRSFTPVFVHCLEYAHAEPQDAPAFNQAVDGSRPAGRSARFNESTGNGPLTLHALDHKAWKEGQTGIVGLVLYWYMDPTNSLSSESSFVISEDRGEFALTEEEQAVVALPEFPKELPEEEIRGMFRWRRYEMRKAAQNARAKGGGKEMAEAIFHQEHMERERDIYAAPGAVSPFSREERERLERGIREPREPPIYLAEGFWARKFYQRQVGHRYLLVMDPSKSGAQDPCVLKLFDAELDLEVVRMSGAVHPKLALEGALRIAREYASDETFGNIFFAWENNTVGNDLRDQAYEMGFPIGQLYLASKERQREYAKWEYGWNTNAATKPGLLLGLVLAVKEGMVRLSDEQSVQELLSYDFDANVTRTVTHTPDGVICDAGYVHTKPYLCPPRALGRSRMEPEWRRRPRVLAAPERGGYASRVAGAGRGYS